MFSITGAMIGCMFHWERMRRQEDQAIGDYSTDTY